MGQLRSKFLKDAWELIGRARGPLALSRLSLGLPERLSQGVLFQPPSDTVSLHDAEEFFVFVDALLGDKTTEHLFAELAGRALAQNSTLVVGYDLLGTVQRLRGWLEAPFVGVHITMELGTTPQGFSVSLGVDGRPRATRLLGKMASGAVSAAERFAMETSGSLALSSHAFGDRCRVDATYESVRVPAAPVALAGPQRESRPASTRPAHFGQLSAEVEEILASARSADARFSGLVDREAKPELRAKAARHSPSGMMKAMTSLDGLPSSAELHPPSGIYPTDQPVQTRQARQTPPGRQSPSGLWPLVPALVPSVDPKVRKDGG